MTEIIREVSCVRICLDSLEFHMLYQNISAYNYIRIYHIRDISSQKIVGLSVKGFIVLCNCHCTRSQGNDHFLL